MNMGKPETETAYFERCRDDLRQELSRYDSQKAYAAILATAGGVLFICNLLGLTGRPNEIIGGVTLAALIAGGIWLWKITTATNGIIERQLEVKHKLRRIREREEQGA